MRGEPTRHLQSGFAARRCRRPVALALPAALALLAATFLASCSSSPSSPNAATTSTTNHASHGATTSTTTTATPGSTLPPVATSGPLTPGGPIVLPFTADRVTATESPDGAVFAAPQDPTSPVPDIAWVVDGNGPAAIAEHVATGIAALAADSNNFYAATYSNVYAYDRASGNQDGQWNMPTVKAANASDNDLVALATGGGKVFVSITQGDTVSVYSLNPAASADPHLVVRGLGDAIGSDGSVYYERSTDHHLAALRPNGTTTVGPALADSPNGVGGGVQYVNTIAAGAVWVSEPAGQGLDATYTTYDAQTLAREGSYGGALTSSVVDTAAGPLVLQPAGSSACPTVPTPVACVLRIDRHGSTSDAVGVGAAVTLVGPGPAVIVSDTTSGQFDVVRLS